MNEKHLSVSELTELIRGCLEGNFSAVMVEGEISNCRPASSGLLCAPLRLFGSQEFCYVL